jgi:phosphatidate cytidylyltransferase
VLLPAILLLAATLSKKTAFVPLLIGLGSVVYIALPIVQLQYLYRQYHLFPLIIFAFLWINDTMAYIIGSFIGKHPLSPVSPKKTWEGTIGGIVLTIAVGAIAAHVWPLLPVNFMAIAGCAAIAGTFGDLLESKLKRMAGVKDSGTIMPGHGGALDRFDSLLLTVPVVCACYLLLH